jgi:hypothetical protein
VPKGGTAARRLSVEAALEELFAEIPFTRLAKKFADRNAKKIKKTLAK